MQSGGGRGKGSNKVSDMLSSSWLRTVLVRNRCRHAPRSSFISDPNGKIEDIVSESVARAPSKIKLRCESTVILDERIEHIA